MAAVLVVRQLDVVYDVCYRTFKQLPVPRKDVLDVLIHDWDQFNAFLLDEAASSIFVQLCHFLHNHQALILNQKSKNCIS